MAKGRTVKAILVDRLAELGADGLYLHLSSSERCGCGIEDLAPCACNGAIPADCVPAMKGHDGLYYPIEMDGGKFPPDEDSEE